MATVPSQSLVATQPKPAAHPSLLLSEARSLRDTLQKLRKRLEEIQLGDVQNQPRDAAEESQNATASEDTVRSPSTETSEERKSPETPKSHDDSEEAEASHVSRSSTESQLRDESPVPRGLGRIRNATVAIVGEMNGAGLRSADTLVRCGIRKLILFDDFDAGEQVEEARLRWELEDNPSFELEAYVSAYELNEDSFEHFLDRLMTGGTDDRPVDLIVLSDTENISASTFQLLIRASNAVRCPLMYRDNAVLYIMEASGEQLEIQESNTLAMATLEFLLAA